ncbi:Crp/Fnr family transcriptional regulator [Aquirufa ecclesiirivi]|uniref:Cyclic nucleotide-binding domain-containing protein n=1 Tax=Aquirufa ecclesiirivi TaxID=2715124 RepID=A0ABT4JK64_9BACT|nr:cyclic nucleotide-binding domain-containing protein [Aquirufa ecclesiirivi]MCZ2471836.1 cyclic nucleotide-binding domain-containing protein [Aquirufa ecclesiirivi]MCZ2476145.1 cyclic nucleotide-binding domain-containing protein [Aquirufa ecclesiirivi]MDF0693549.1 cyclic nucleotide-binding domain-containing protein [Aquirufa ecclesiirivi]NHC49456.1 cyclic nucleotide-binding domain-containing protein [Aquirufa ecclesiirivi]
MTTLASLEAYLKTFNLLNPAETKQLAGYFKPAVFQKNQIIIAEGEINSKFYFLASGLLREYSWVDQLDMPEPISRWFTLPGKFGISAESFFHERPSEITLDALKKSEVFYMEKDDLERAYVEIPHSNTICRIILQETLVQHERITSFLHIRNTQIRYEAFRKSFKDMDEQVPDKYKASFLNMSPSELSRVRRKIMENGSLID